MTEADLVAASQREAWVGYVEDYPALDFPGWVVVARNLEFDLQVGFWQILQNTSEKNNRFSVQNKNLRNDNKYRQTTTNPKKYIK